MRTLLAPVFLLAACGAPATQPAASPEPASVDQPVVVAAEAPVDTREPAEVEDVAPSDALDDDNEMACARDADCVVGGPGRCCASSGPECAQAWSRTAWRAFRSSCDARSCDRVVSMVCPGSGFEGEVQAVCVQARCQLRAAR